MTNQFYRVMNFLDPPTRLFSPRMLTELTRAAFRKPSGTMSSRDAPSHDVLQAGKAG